MGRTSSLNQLRRTGIGSGAQHKFNAVAPRQEALDQQDCIATVGRIERRRVETGSKNLPAFEKIADGDVAEITDDGALVLGHPPDGPVGKFLEYRVVDPHVLPSLTAVGAQTIAGPESLDLVVVGQDGFPNLDVRGRR